MSEVLPQVQPVQPEPPGIASGARPNWIAAIFAGLVAGLVSAVLYAVISAAIEHEILFLIIAVGAIVGFVVAKVSRVDSVLTGVIATVIAAGAIAAAIILYMATLAFGNIVEAVQNLGNLRYDKVFEIYFDDPLGYVWAGVGLISAFAVGSGTALKK